MQVKNVYQDAEGKWHIDYDTGHLMGLAIRVYCGELLIGTFISIFISLPLLLLATIALGNSPQKPQNSFPNSDRIVLQESTCNERY